jgi:hypothetical protein
MPRAIALMGCAATLAAGMTAASAPTPRARQPRSPAEFVAFRVDDAHAIAAIKVLDDISTRTGLGHVTAHPPARYGFPHFEPWPELRDRVPPEIRSTATWVLHVGARLRLRAATERIVGANAHCQDAVGILLRVVPDDAAAFAATRARYYLAEAGGTASSPAPSGVMQQAEATLTTGQRAVLEQILDGLRQQELPKIRSERDDVLQRMAESAVASQRRAAAERQRIDAEVAAGRARLDYDVQAFRLAPDDSVQYFVRAQWRVNGKLGFAASIWARDDRQEFKIVEQDLKPARWLRMGEFQGELGLPRLGLILNVFDRDGDGWGEVLVAQEGYEGFSLQLLEYGPTGLEPTGIGYGAGC